MSDMHLEENVVYNEEYVRFGSNGEYEKEYVDEYEREYEEEYEREYKKENILPIDIPELIITKTGLYFIDIAAGNIEK